MYEGAFMICMKDQFANRVVVSEFCVIVRLHQWLGWVYALSLSSILQDYG